MTIRQVAQAKIYALALNPVTASCETAKIAAISTEYDALVKFYQDNLLSEGIRQDGYYRSFKEGPLYNYNPCYSLFPDEVGYYSHGIHTYWTPLKN